MTNLSEKAILDYCEVYRVPLELHGAVVTTLQTNRCPTGFDGIQQQSVYDWATCVTEYYAPPPAGYCFETGCIDES
jgi:hypothetical protein